MEDFKTIDDYIAAQPEETGKKLIELRECIRIAAPDAEELFNYGIPAFALVPGGKRDKQIMMAGYRKHVGLYPHPASMEEFEEELVLYKKGKGSVQFPLDQPLPRELVIRMVKYRKELVETEKKG